MGELPVNAAASLAILAAGCFFLTGLLTGVWKYAQIHNSPGARAHPYVTIAHRAALMYSFACLLLANFVSISQLADNIELIAIAVQVIFFAAAIASYILHGLLQDTHNQLQRPHRLGKGQLPAWLMTAFMVALVIGEVGGFAVIFYGVLLAIF